jgi:hypothetical protein
MVNVFQKSPRTARLIRSTIFIKISSIIKPEKILLLEPVIGGGITTGASSTDPVRALRLESIARRPSLTKKTATFAPGLQAPEGVVLKLAVEDNASPLVLLCTL